MDDNNILATICERVFQRSIINAASVPTSTIKKDKPKLKRPKITSFKQAFREATNDHYIDSSAGYSQRISQAGSSQNKIWDMIRVKFPTTTIRIANAREDMAGVDAYVRSAPAAGQPQKPEKTVQLKHRQSGDDILLEVIRPWNGASNITQFTGRDMKVNVDLYFCVDTHLVLRIIKNDVLKAAATSIANEFIKQNSANPHTKTVHTQLGMATIKTDDSYQTSYGMGRVDKLIVYVNPSKIDVSVTVKLQ